jgi:hypothetical protein
VISDVDETISHLLQTELGLSANQISYEPPDILASGKVDLPGNGASLSLYLYELTENMEYKQGQRIVERPTAPTKKGEVGLAVIKAPPVYFNLYYVISAWGGSQAEIRNLMLDTSLVLMKKPVLPVDLFAGELREQITQPLHTLVQSAGEDLTEFWQAFGVTPRPAIFYRVILPVSLDALYEARIVRVRKIKLYQKNTRQEG